MITVITLDIGGEIVETTDKIEALKLLKPNYEYLISMDTACSFFSKQRIVTWSFPKQYADKILSIRYRGKRYSRRQHD